MLCPGRIGRDEGQIDVGGLLGGEFLFGLFRCFTEPLQGHGVLAEIDAVLFLELTGNEPDQSFIEVVTAKVSVTVGAEHFDQFVFDFEDRDVEGSAAEVKHADFFFAFLFESIGESGCRGLVNNTGHLKTGDLACVLGCLTLSIVEVGGHGDDRLIHFMTEMILSGLFELSQDERGDFGRCVFLAVNIDFDVIGCGTDDLVGHQFLFGFHFTVSSAHEAFDGVDGVLRVGDGLTFCGFADECFAFGRERDDAGGCAAAFLIRDHARLAAFHDRHHGICCSQVDADDFFSGNSHDTCPSERVPSPVRKARDSDRWKSQKR